MVLHSVSITGYPRQHQAAEARKFNAPLSVLRVIVLPPLAFMRIPAGQRQNNNISYTRWTELTHYSLHASFLKRPTRSRVFHWLNVEYDVNISVLVVGAYIHAFLPTHACSSFTPRFVDNVLIPQTIRKVTRMIAQEVIIGTLKLIPYHVFPYGVPYTSKQLRRKLMRDIRAPRSHFGSISFMF